MPVIIKLAQQGNGAKVHAGYEIHNENGSVHHVALECDYFPVNKARLVGTTEDPTKVTCGKCRHCIEKAIANKVQ